MNEKNADADLSTNLDTSRCCTQIRVWSCHRLINLTHVFDKSVCLLYGGDKDINFLLIILHRILFYAIYVKTLLQVS